jgi:Rrf2 family protein
VLSRKTKYGLKALLVLAEEYGKGPVQISELAERGATPRKFLETILVSMKTHGFVDSKKGKAGGYVLARTPDAISVAEVVRVLEGPLALLPCASLTAYRKCDDCLDERRCGIRLVMSEVRDATARILDATTLAGILERVRRCSAEQESPPAGGAREVPELSSMSPSGSPKAALPDGSKPGGDPS